VREIAATTTGVIESAVHPESPLQGWRFVLQMLQQPGRAVLVDRERRSSAMLQLAAWDDLLRLSPPRRILELVLRRFEELRLANPGLPGIARVGASLLLAHSPEAERYMQPWIVESQGDPDAWACRLRRLRTGELEAACDDAVVAVQRTADEPGGVGRDRATAPRPRPRRA
jgi:hypothetical protein